MRLKDDDWSLDHLPSRDTLNDLIHEDWVSYMRLLGARVEAAQQTRELIESDAARRKQLDERC